MWSVRYKNRDVARVMLTWGLQAAPLSLWGGWAGRGPVTRLTELRAGEARREAWNCWMSGSEMTPITITCLCACMCAHRCISVHVFVYEFTHMHEFACIAMYQYECVWFMPL